MGSSDGKTTKKPKIARLSSRLEVFQSAFTRELVNAICFVEPFDTNLHIRLARCQVVLVEQRAEAASLIYLWLVLHTGARLRTL